MTSWLYRRGMLRARGTRAVGSVEHDEDLEALVAAAADNDNTAWQKLWAVVEPRLLALVRKPRVSGPLSHSEDDCRNIVTEVMARLHDDNQRRLKRYLDARAKKPSLTFMPWLIVVAKRTAIDYRRAHDLYLDRRAERDASAAGKWVVPGTLPTASRLGGTRPPVTRRGTAHEMLQYAGANLPEQYRQALELWIHSVGYADIAEQLELDTAKEAQRIVRAGLERLRRHFRNQEGEDEP